MGRRHQDIVAAIADDITEDINTNNGLADDDAPLSVMSEEVDTTQIAKKVRKNIDLDAHEYASRPRRQPDFEPMARDWEFERNRHPRLPPPPQERRGHLPVVLPNDGSIRIIRGNDGRTTLNQPIERIMEKIQPVVEAVARPVGKMGKRKLDL